jgi:hypothetical protein
MAQVTLTRGRQTSGNRFLSSAPIRHWDQALAEALLLIAGVPGAAPADPSWRATDMHPDVSVLCAVHRHTALTAQCLAALRELPDKVSAEIVVAVDSRLGTSGLGALSEVADRLVAFEFSGPNRFRPWLREQAHGDWLLLLDGDELVSQALLDSLPELIADRSVAGYVLPRISPYPDAGTHPIGGHWDQDRQMRLVRNDGRLWFPATKHTGAECDPPIRRAEAAIIHLHLLIDSVAARREKVARYTGEKFGLMSHDGLPLNEAYYLPEDQDDLQWKPLSTADRRRTESVMRFLSTDAGRFPGPLPVASARDVESWIVGRALSADEAQGAVEVLAAPDAVPARSPFSVELTLTNTGGAVWGLARGATNCLNLSYHWTSSSGEIGVFDGIRTPLASRVLPGETVGTTLAVLAPDSPGQWTLVIDMVQEGVRWFGIDRTIPVAVQSAVADDLRAAAEPLIPVDTAIGQRRRLTRLDGLADAWGANAAAEDIAGLSFGGWAMDRSTLAYLTERMRTEHLCRVLEFGSGTSSVVLGQAASELGGRMLSIEQDSHHAERVRGMLQARGLDRAVTVRHAGLGVVSACGLTTVCYTLSPDLRAEILRLRPQLVVIDGPSQVSGASRLAVLPSVCDLLEPGTRFGLDDAFRDAELQVARHWSDHPAITVLGIAAVGKGLLVGTAGSRSAPGGG